ncbi:MAG: hypothetical protein SGJ13_08685 [Actinomycetota bacterium]|nr:hypothetical protein [Actinomycetota bacterium]
METITHDFDSTPRRRPSRLTVTLVAAAAAALVLGGCGGGDDDDDSASESGPASETSTSAEANAAADVDIREVLDVAPEELVTVFIDATYGDGWGGPDDDPNTFVSDVTHLPGLYTIVTDASSPKQANVYCELSAPVLAYFLGDSGYSLFVRGEDPLSKFVLVEAFPCAPAEVPTDIAAATAPDDAGDVASRANYFVRDVVEDADWYSGGGYVQFGDSDFEFDCTSVDGVVPCAEIQAMLEWLMVDADGETVPYSLTANQKPCT